MAWTGYTPASVYFTEGKQRRKTNREVLNSIHGVEAPTNDSWFTVDWFSIIAQPLPDYTVVSDTYDEVVF